MLTHRDLEGLFGRVILNEYTDRTLADMGALELREALKDIPGAESLTISYNLDNGNQIVHCAGKTVEVGPMASYDEIRAALSNPFVPTKNTKVRMSSALDRIKAKALQAKGIASQALSEVETDLDGLIAEKAILDQRRAEAVAPHKEMIAGIKAELDDVKSALDLLSNNGPPLDHQ